MYFERCLSVDDEVFQTLACNAHADPADLLAADFDFDLARMVNEDTVVAVGDVERDAFVSLFTRSSSILVPDANRLSCDHILGRNTEL